MSVEESPILQFHDVTAYRNDTKVMNQFSMTINNGQHTAIVGPNGSGKSTFIQLLTHQLYPVAPKEDASPIRVFGKDHWNVSELRKRIGIVSAEMEYEIAHNLNHGRLSGKQVVLTGFFSSMQLFGHHRINEEMKKKAEWALETIEASYLADRRFSRMSSGEARRVLIARALVTSPDMLVLDEPTTALDLVARETCLQLIRDIANQGTTIIIVTHHIEEIIPEISHVVLLKDGSAAYAGSKEQVITSKNMSKVYNHPLRVENGQDRYRIALEKSD